MIRWTLFLLALAPLVACSPLRRVRPVPQSSAPAMRRALLGAQHLDARRFATELLRTATSLSLPDGALYVSAAPQGHALVARSHTTGGLDWTRRLRVDRGRAITPHLAGDRLVLVHGPRRLPAQFEAKRARGGRLSVDVLALATGAPIAHLDFDSDPAPDEPAARALAAVSQDGRYLAALHVHIMGEARYVADLWRVDLQTFERRHRRLEGDGVVTQRPSWALAALDDGRIAVAHPIEGGARVTLVGPEGAPRRLTIPVSDPEARQIRGLAIHAAPGRLVITGVERNQSSVTRALFFDYGQTTRLEAFFRAEVDLGGQRPRLRRAQRAPDSLPRNPIFWSVVGSELLADGRVIFLLECQGMNTVERRRWDDLQEEWVYDEVIAQQLVVTDFGLAMMAADGRIDWIQTVERSKAWIGWIDAPPGVRLAVDAGNVDVLALRREGFSYDAIRRLRFDLRDGRVLLNEDIAEGPAGLPTAFDPLRIPLLGTAWLGKPGAGGDTAELQVEALYLESPRPTSKKTAPPRRVSK